jgi:hypothetical protein
MGVFTLRLDIIWVLVLCSFRMSNWSVGFNELRLNFIVITSVSFTYRPLHENRNQSEIYVSMKISFCPH